MDYHYLSVKDNMPKIAFMNRKIIARFNTEQKSKESSSKDK